jgi:hypothetical protein
MAGACVADRGSSAPHCTHAWGAHAAARGQAHFWKASSGRRDASKADAPPPPPSPSPRGFISPGAACWGALCAWTHH